MGERESAWPGLAKGTEMGEDRGGCCRFAEWKGRERSTASLAIRGLRNHKPRRFAARRLVVAGLQKSLSIWGKGEEHS